jgi:hypothetical protein
VQLQKETRWGCQRALREVLRAWLLDQVSLAARSRRVVLTILWGCREVVCGNEDGVRYNNMIHEDARPMELMGYLKNIWYNALMTECHQTWSYCTRNTQTTARCDAVWLGSMAKSIRSYPGHSRRQLEDLEHRRLCVRRRS